MISEQRSFPCTATTNWFL